MDSENIKPLISIIIPVYNVKDYIKQCIDSVVCQSYKNLEIIIIDDGSTDGGELICDEYSEIDKRILVYHKKNEGLASARNFGLQHISVNSKYIVFLDSDDWIESNTIQDFYDAAYKFNADIVSCPYYFENKIGKSISYNIGDCKVLINDQILRHYVINGDIGRVVWNKLYRTELFCDIQFPVGAIYEDIYTTYKLLINSRKVVLLPNAFIHYRLRENSLSRNYSMKSLIDYWNANFQQYKVLINRIHEKEYSQALIRCCLSAINHMWRGYASFSQEEKNNCENTINEMMRFISEHRKNILCEKEYSLYFKCTCIVASSKNMILMWSINLLYNIYRKLKKYRSFG